MYDLGNFDSRNLRRNKYRRPEQGEGLLKCFAAGISLGLAIGVCLWLISGFMIGA